MSADNVKVSAGMWANFDSMCWPFPGERMDALEHLLRYGQPTKSDLLAAASIVAAYGAMVNASAKNRSKVVRVLRKASKSVSKEAP